MLGTTRWILRGLNWANWIIGLLAVTAGIAVGYVLPDQFLATAMQAGMRAPDALLGWIRVVFPLTAPVILLAHIMFTRLISVIDDARAGAAFSTINAARLRLVAWALLGTQIIDLAFGLYSQAVSEASGEYLGWSFGITGWLAVLLLFVLSRIFQQGAAIEAELAQVV